MKNNMLCACVIFPGIEKYLPDFFTSIIEQTNNKFTLLIIEDGISSKDYINKVVVKCVVEQAKGKTTISNREQIINYAVHNKFEKLIFFDVDDLYSDNRVEVLDKMLNKHSLVVHDMDIINESGKLVANSFIDGQVSKGAFDFKELLYKNFSGLGNSGYRIDSLLNYTKVRDDIIAFDWWVALNILQKNTGYYLPEVLSHYRRYAKNSSVLGNVSEENINLEYKTKILLYSELLLKEIKDKLHAELVENALARVVHNYYSTIEGKDLEARSHHLWWDCL